MPAGSYKGDVYFGDQWPAAPRQAQRPVSGAKGGVVSLKGDRRPGVTVKRR